MSAPLRAQIVLLKEAGDEFIANKKTFPLPPANGISTSQYHAQLRTLISSLNHELGEVSEVVNDLSHVHNQWMAIRGSMTGAERAIDNPLYDQFIIDTPYLRLLADLKKYQKEMRTSLQALAAALPDPSQQSNHLHLPKISLPKFSGNCTEYVSFSNAFRAGVDESSLSDSVKFNYLKECLEGPALLLVKPLPLTDASKKKKNGKFCDKKH